MTKETFCTLYDVFTTMIKQEVNDQYVWNASCEMPGESSGYGLILHPECMIWGSEIAFLSSLCERLCVSLAIYPWRSEIRIW